MDKTPEAVVKTVANLNNCQQQELEFEEQAKAKRAALAELRNVSEETKEKIREAMTFRLVDAKGKEHEKSFDEKGQEYAIDTVGSVKKGHGLKAEDVNKVYGAMEHIVELTKKALAAEAGGVKIFDPTPRQGEKEADAIKRVNDEIEREVFTPLVREGLLPETFVLDRYSEVAKLLKAAMGSYKQSLGDAEDDKALENAKIDADWAGAGSTKDKLKAGGGKLERTVERVKRQMMSEQRERELMIGGQLGMLAVKGLKAKTAVTKMANGKALNMAEKLLSPGGHEDVFASDSDRLVGYQASSDSDERHLLLVQEQREQRLIESFSANPLFAGDPEAAAQTVAGIQDYLETKGVQRARFGTELAAELIKTGLVAKDVYDATELAKEIDNATSVLQIQDAADRAARELDAALVNEISKHSQSAAVAFDGVYFAQAASNLDAAAKKKNPGVHVVGEIAAAYEAAFTAAAAASVKNEFAKVGKSIRESVDSKGLGGSLDEALLKDVGTAFGPVVSAINKTVSSSLSGPITALLNDKGNVQEMIAASLQLDSEEKLDELYQTSDEIKEYEKMLVLIDEGGIKAAEQVRIEKLIAQIQHDRKILDVVAQLSGSVLSIASTSVKVNALNSPDLTNAVAGSIVGALQAAKIVMQLATNVIKAAERWRLWSAFRTDLKRSNIAVSSLSSTIQGFYNNKKEQITFRTIEDALLAVELAANIIGSVPTPYTIALGKTMTAVNAAAQQAAKVSEMIYNERQLRKAWETTKAALDDPTDRAKGLAALRLNPTLGMHALAWAGMEKEPPDPIARMALDSVGLNEQTLAASGTEAKVRQYMETLLHEDRNMLKPDELKVKWVPAELSLSVKDWFTVSKRGEREARPPLRENDSAAIVDLLKPIDRHDPDTWETSAKTGAIEPSQMSQYVSEIDALIASLKQYSPTAKNGNVHEEMASIVSSYLAMASKHRDRLTSIADANAGNR